MTYIHINPQHCMFIRVCLLLCLIPAMNAAAFFRNSEEYRSINTDMYEISIARNGLTDLLLLSGESIFESAHVRYQLAGGRDQHANLPGRNTNRQEVQDRLGQGQGFVFAHRNLEWYIRAYPTKPFIAVQAVYVNTGRNPVRVERLSPWAVQSDRGNGAFSLGANAENVRILPTADGAPNLASATGPIQSEDSLMLYNPTTGRSLIAGFLTANDGRGVITLERDSNTPNHAFTGFRADCVYDPPVELAPGERLESEVFYLGITESEALLGMERYAKAFAVVNGVREPESALPSGFRLRIPEQATPLYGATVAAWLEEAAITPNDHFNTLLWDASWLTAPDRLEANPQHLREGFAPLLEAAQTLGYVSLLEVAPLLCTDPAQRSDQIAADAWMPLRETARNRFAPHTHVLDITHPESEQYLRQQMQQVLDWGFAGVLAQHADAAFYATLPEDGPTALRRVHTALNTLRGALPDAAPFIVSPATMHTGLHADYALMDGGLTPGSAGTLEQRNARTAARFHLTPSLFEGVFQSWTAPAHVDNPANLAAWRQTLSQMALSGGTVLLPWRPDLSPELVNTLNAMLPPSGKTARPANVAPNAPIGIWHAPIYRDGQSLHLLGLQHLEGEDAQQVNLAFHQVGLDPSTYYTVFDLWQRQYFGTAQGQLSVQVAPGHTRLLLLRPHENRPALQWVENQSPPWSTRHGVARWDATDRSLKGQFQGRRDEHARVRVSVPEPWRFLDAFSGPGEMQATLADQIVELNVHPRHDGPIDWEIRFHDGRSSTP